MILPVVWLPEADAELKEALAHYDTIRPELATRFAEAVIDTVDLMAAAPLQFAVVEKGRRRAGVRRFPYGIFFIVEEAASWSLPASTASGIPNTGSCASSFTALFAVAAAAQIPGLCNTGETPKTARTTRIGLYPILFPL